MDKFRRRWEIDNDLPDPIVQSARFLRDFAVNHKLAVGIASASVITLGGLGYWAWDASHVRTFRSETERDHAVEEWIEAGGYKRWTTTKEVANRGQIPNPLYPAWKEKEDAAKAEALAKCATAGDWRLKSNYLYKNKTYNPGPRGDKPVLANFQKQHPNNSSFAELMYRNALRRYNRHPQLFAAWQKADRELKAQRVSDIAKDQQNCKARAEKRRYTWPRVSKTKYGITGYETVTSNHSRAWRRCNWEPKLDQNVCWDTRTAEPNRRYTYFRVQ